jgi:microcystin-dependent protein
MSVPSGTLVTPGGAQGPSGSVAPVADSTQNGLLKKVSGLSTDFVDGTNNCQNLLNAVFPSGMVMDFAGASAPSGFLLCDGTSYLTASYPALFAAIGYTYGGSGANFNVPDCKGRTTIGAGAGAGLTNRVLGTKVSNEETHALVLAEEAPHAHNVPAGQFNHSHTGPQAIRWDSFAGATGPYQILFTLNSGSNQYWNGTTNNNTLPAGVTDSQGSGTAHNNMQPSIVFNKIIKI